MNYKALKYILIIITLSACSYKNNNTDTEKYSKHFKNDVFDYSGSYEWSFDLMGGKQISTHIIYKDSIMYKMTGKIYSTEYTMRKLSYEKEKNKWIGEDKNGNIYVLFFKEKTDTTVTIFKHKCKLKGLEEALKFNIPAPETTDDHGWNIYAFNRNDTKDNLPIIGIFNNIHKRIMISDSIINFDKKKAIKLSFHQGERRWVGKYKNQYLQVFFKNINIKDSIKLSTTWSNDLEKLYKTKYNSITNWESYKKTKE